TAYVVFPNYDLTDYREQIPVYRWEVAAVAEVDEPAAMVALKIQNSVYGWNESPDGDTWDQPWKPMIGGISSTQLVTTRAAYVTYSPGYSPVAHMTDPSIGWAVSDGVGVGTGGGVKLGWGHENIAVIPTASVSGLSVSYDHGASFETKMPGVGINIVFKIGNVWVGLNTATRDIYVGSPELMEVEGQYPAGIFGTALDHD